MSKQSQHRRGAKKLDRRIHPSRPYACEALEQRTLLTAPIIVQGTAGNDDIAFTLGQFKDPSNNNILTDELFIRVNAQLSDYWGDVTIPVVVNTLGGNDHVSIDGLFDHPLTINFGAGNDTAQMNYGPADGFDHPTGFGVPIQVNGGGGVDALSVSDNEYIVTGDIYNIDGSSITDTALDRYGNIASTVQRVGYSGMQNLTLFTSPYPPPPLFGPDLDTVNILSSDATLTSVVTAPNRNAIFNVGAVSAPVHLTGGNAANTFNLAGANTASTYCTGGSGNNVFNVAGTTFADFLIGGSGANAFNVTANTGAMVGVTGSGGSNTLEIDGGSSALFYTISGSDVFAGPQDIKYSGIQSLTVNTGTGADYVSVQALSTPTTVTTSGGFDTVDVIGGFTGLSAIGATLSISNPKSYTTLTLDDSNDTTNRNLLLTDSSLVGFSAAINWVAADVNGVTVFGGSGFNTFTVTGTDPLFGNAQNILNAGPSADHVYIESMQNALVVNMQGGADTVDVTETTRNMDTIAGALTVNGNSSSTMNLNDQLSQNLIFTTYAFYSWGFNRSTTTVIFGQVVARNESVAASGLGNVVLNAGAFVNEVNVEGASTPITINASPATAVVVVSPSAENLNNVQNTVTVNGNGTLPLSIEDQNNLSVVPVQNTLTATSFTSLGYNYILVNGNIQILLPYFSLINFNNVGSVTFDAGTVANSYDVQNTAAGITTTVNAGSGQSTVNVDATTGPLVINGQGGADTVTIGKSGSAQAVLGAVTVGNVGGVTGLTLDDSADSVGRVVTVAASSISGLAPATIYYTQGNGSVINPLSVNTGTGADTVNGTGSGNFDLATGPGDDTVNLGAGSNQMSGFIGDGGLGLNGGTGTNTLNIDDQAAGQASTWTANSIRVFDVSPGIGGFTITPSNFASIAINSGAYGCTFNVSSTAATATSIVLNEGAGNDANTIGVAHVVSKVTISGNGGTNTLVMNDSSATSAAIVHVTPTQIGAAPGDNFFPVGGAVTYSGISSATISTPNATTGDTISVTPSSTTAFTINGGNPTTSPGDALTVGLAGATNPVLTPNGTGAGQYTFGNRMPVTFTGIEQSTVNSVTPTIAPAGAILQYNALPLSLSFGFTETLAASPPLSAFSATSQANVAVPFSGVSFAGNVATVSISGALPDGNYHGVIQAAGVVDQSGNAMSSDYAFDFFSLTGDANHDRFVDSMDFTMLAQNFNAVNVGVRHGDLNYDGKVNALDFNILATKFGTHLLPSASAPIVGSMVNPAASAPVAALPLATLFSDKAIKSPVKLDVLGVAVN